MPVILSSQTFKAVEGICEGAGVAGVVGVGKGPGSIGVLGHATNDSIIGFSKLIYAVLVARSALPRSNSKQCAAFDTLFSYRFTYQKRRKMVYNILLYLAIIEAASR